jgi:FAD synthase
LILIILQMVGPLGRVISSLQGFYLNKGQHKHKINTYHTSMSCVGFEPTIPASERAKTVYALDLSATLTGNVYVIVQLKNLKKIPSDHGR